MTLIGAVLDLVTAAFESQPLSNVRKKKQAVWSDPRAETLSNYLSENAGDTDTKSLRLLIGASERETKFLLQQIGATETIARQGQPCWKLSR